MDSFERQFFWRRNAEITTANDTHLQAFILSKTKDGLYFKIIPDDDAIIFYPWRSIQSIRFTEDTAQESL